MMKKKYYFLLLLLLKGVLSAAVFGQSASGNIPTDPVSVTPLSPYTDLYTLPANTKVNFVKSTKYNIPSTTVTTSYNSVVTEYYDGMSRPIQQVTKLSGISGSNRYDVISPVVYDEYGKQSKQYLPYAREFVVDWSGGSGKMVPGLQAAYTAAYPLDQGEHPYSSRLIERSPLNRVQKDMAAGSQWVGGGRGVVYTYGANIKMNNSGVEQKGIYPRFEIGYATNAIPEYKGDYAYGELRMVRTIDEDNKRSEVYTDKAGRTVFSRMLKSPGGTVNLAIPQSYDYTIYVYDEMGRLRFVIPPAAAKPALQSSTATQDIYTWSFSTAAVAGLCYQYWYDGRGRLVEKKLPGRAKESFVYDKRDRLVLNQDGNLVAADWYFTFYDGLDRPTVEGRITNSSSSRTTQQAVLDNATTYTPAQWGYYVKNYSLEDPYPAVTVTNTTPELYNYYDDYTRTHSPLAYDASPFAATGLPVTVNLHPGITRAKGKPTGAKVAVLNPLAVTDVPEWLYAASYYDAKGRAVQSLSTNISNGTDKVSTLYYFNNLPWKSIHKHTNPLATAQPGATDVLTEMTVEEVYNRNISAAGGDGTLMHHTRKINGGIAYDYARHSYDHLGRSVLSVFPAFNAAYKYNRRGFTEEMKYSEPGTGLGATFFQENLFYASGFTNKYYNGNIAGITWINYHMSGATFPRVHAYGYSYDGQNRLTHAEYRHTNNDLMAPAWVKTQLDYTVSDLTYDDNGNIKTMKQRGVLPSGMIDMDNLTYTYEAEGNKLIKVEDAVPPAVTASLPDFKNGASTATEYTYSNNGNLLSDANKGISSITNNKFNKPIQITVTGKGSIKYIYDALGNTHSKVISPTGGTAFRYDYTAGYVYRDNRLQYAATPDGRMRPRVGTDGLTKFVYDYFTRDHLGNVRSTVTAEPMSMDYLAQHEIASAYIENLFFDNIPPVRATKPGGSGPDQYAIMLDGADTARRVGTSLMLRVMPGDRFDVSVDALYMDSAASQQQSTVPADQILNALLSTLTGGSTYAGVPLSELPQNVQMVHAALSQPGLSTALADIYNGAEVAPGKPKAYLNYLFFNQQMQLDNAHSGAIPMGGSIGTWHALSASGGILIPEPGFLLIFVNTAEVGRNVWFDDLHVGHYNGQVLDESHYYPFGLTLTSTAAGSTEQPHKYQGIQLEKNFGLETYETFYRGLDPQLGRFNNIDPKSELFYSVSPYASMNNNPASIIDPLGDDWVEATDGGIRWNDNVTAKNYQDKGVLQEGEIYRGTSYERVRDWSNVQLSNGTTVNNVVLEQYGTNKKMTYDEMSSASLSIDGEMRKGNDNLGDVTIKTTVTFASGQKRVLDGGFTGVAGGFGNGAPENGDYTVDNYQNRGKDGWYNKGMTRDGVGFSFNLNPTFSTGRTLLRIHPDGNNEGTLGCIGLSGNASTLGGFSDNLRWILKYQKSIPAHININGNPNNNGRSGKKIPNVNE